MTTFLLGVATGAVGWMALSVATVAAMCLWARAMDRRAMREDAAEPPVEQWAKEMKDR